MAFAHLRAAGTIEFTPGRPGPLPAPIDNFEATLSATEQSILAQSDAAAAVGNFDQVRDQVAAFVAQLRWMS